jgi:hypothetical protein
LLEGSQDARARQFHKCRVKLKTLERL